MATSNFRISNSNVCCVCFYRLTHKTFMFKKLPIIWSYGKVMINTFFNENFGICLTKHIRKYIQLTTAYLFPKILTTEGCSKEHMSSA